MPALYSGEVFAEGTLQTYLEGIPLPIGALISYDTLGYRSQGIFPRTAPLHDQPPFVGSLGEKRKLANARTLIIPEPPRDKEILILVLACSPKRLLVIGRRSREKTPQRVAQRLQMRIKILLRRGHRIKMNIITRDRSRQKTPIIRIQIPSIGLYDKFLDGILSNQVAILLPIEIQPDKLGDNRYGKDKQPYAHQDGAQIHYPISLYFLTHL